jgi:hypothetical protein
MLTRLRRGLANVLLGKEAVRTATAPQSPSAARAGMRVGDSGASEEARLVEQIKNLIGANAAPLVGRLNLIGLSKIKERFGAEWPRIAQRADRIARNVIERHVGPGDVYASWGPETYVIVFARLGEAEARVKCLLIGTEIAKSLLGEEGTEHLEIKTAVARLDGALDFENLGSLGKLLDTAKPIDALQPQTKSAGATAPPPSAAATQETSNSDYLTLVPVERRPSPPPKVESGVRANVLAGMDFVFCPMWDPVRNVIATYYCKPIVRLSDVEGATGDAELAVAGDSEATARLDAATIERVKQELVAMVAAGRRLNIVAPIHFETLSSMGQRRRIAAALGKIEDAMKTCLMIEIVGVPDGVQKSRIMDIAAPLRPHCRGVALQMLMETIDFIQLTGAGIAAVGADVTYASKAESIQMQQLSRFQRAAEKVGVATFVHGARSLSLAAAAMGAGFNFIDGDAVAASVPHVDRALAFQLADLYRAR